MQLVDDKCKSFLFGYALLLMLLKSNLYDKYAHNYLSIEKY